MGEYELYIFYLALKRHFTSDYDFFKYQGKIRASRQSFEGRRDRYFFGKLAKRKDAKELILANMVTDPKIWIGDLLGDTAETVYKDWLKRQQSLTHTFKSELNLLHDEFDENVIVKNGQHPPLLKLVLSKKISLETLIILDDLMKFIPYWEAKISDSILFPDLNKRVKNYRPFLQYDKTKMRGLVLDRYNEYT